MGTRNLTMVKVNGEMKVAQYGQWDGYVNYMGLRILSFLKQTMSREYSRNKFEEQVSKIQFISDEEIKLIENFMETLENKGMNASLSHNFPEFSRDTGCDILAMIGKMNTKGNGNPIKLINNLDELEAGYIEFGYLINLDEDTFEVYTSYDTDKNKLKKGSIKTNKNCILVYSLNKLPSYKKMVQDYNNLYEEEEISLPKRIPVMVD